MKEDEMHITTKSAFIKVVLHRSKVRERVKLL